MPLLTLTVAAAPSAPLTAGAAAFLLDATRTILGKDPALTAVVVRYADPDAWFVGGESLGAQRRTSFAFDIAITEGTNTKSEKAEYLATVHDGLCALLRAHGLGAVHDVSYITVHDLRADAWGYAGRSQEHRFVQGRTV